MTLFQLLALSLVNACTPSTMQSSAVLCHNDALAALGRSDFAVAAAHALKSLKYSIGILHPDYERARVAMEAGVSSLVPAPAHNVPAECPCAPCRASEALANDLEAFIGAR